MLWIITAFTKMFCLKGGHPVECHQIYNIFSTANTQHMQRPDVLLQLGYTWRNVSAVKWPSSGQLRIISLRLSPH